MPFVTTDESTYFYRLSDSTENKKHTALFLHGSGGDGAVWDYQLSGLGSLCNVIIPDLPCHGRSKGNMMNTVAEYVEWLEHFVSTLKLFSFFLVGHSLGGAIAQEYTYKNPEKTKGLILIGTGIRFNVLPDYLQLLQDDFEAAVKTSCMGAYSSSVSDELYQKGYEMLLKNGKAILYLDMLSCKQFDSSSWISSIEIPTLIFCGRDDKITPCESSHELANRLSNSRLHVVSGAGHMVMIESPEVFNGVVKNFMKEINFE